MSHEGRGRLAVTAAALAVVAVAAGAGYFSGVLLGPLTHNRNFPWIVARATGIGAFLAMAALCFTGLVFRRPTGRQGRLHPETQLRVHAVLGAAVLALLAGHIASLLADRYSGVTWASLVVPNAAHYRPGAVTWGSTAAITATAVVVTAAMAGRRLVGGRWALVHRLAVPAFALTWVHGVLAGSDTAALRLVYVLVGGDYHLAGFQ